MSGRARERDDEAFWEWMDAYAEEPHNAQYEAADMQRAYEAGRDGTDSERAERRRLAGERDEARSDFARLRTALLEGGQSDAAVRKRCLAIIATAGTSRAAEPQAAPEPDAAMAALAAAREHIAWIWRNTPDETARDKADQALHQLTAGGVTAPGREPGEAE